ncbi:ATP-dependent zinc metalloprotease FtsH [Candidatus Woesebacteria bacterium]|nr:ATP-dependent zinc metalloprotease FtsH [Candidatus Woesebacteria bacterium]MCD8507412.1 ATP-dependent zinc metalloprotease FtsH [Candidatus Woesebacteria bacterium]MCD8527351.1 ATP-dependent zinc metalloprotease FtsH [Candidatus Woesebacteria bacterium]MCD8546098.1 ATP-dependent zinc metalloprotease FtsH [Candidatus Woesebacteria bacterium]
MAEKTSSNSQKSSPSSSKKAGRRIEMQFNFNPRRMFVWLLLALLFLPLLVNIFFGANREEVALSQLLQDVRSEQVASVEVSGADVALQYEDGTEKKSRMENGQDFVSLLEQIGVDPTSVEISVKGMTAASLFWDFVVNFLPLLLMVVFFLFLFRQARGAQGDMLGFGKSKAKFFVKGKQDISFKDVGGMKEAKQELEEIVDFMKHPKKYRDLGARTPKGVLLVGPAGTGKTLLARAVAGEAGVSYLSIAGSEFMEMLVGVGAARVRDLFETAKKMAPAIIFIDEIDAIGRKRGHSSGVGSHDEREQTLNQILVEMDGFTPKDNVVVLAATNRGDVLDPALTRPGRFDRRVSVTLPDIEERKKVLAIHSENKPFTDDVNWEVVAKRTVGFSGADLENMLNEAAILAARENKKKIDMKDIEEAALKVKLGPSKKRLQSEYERRMTAYHEVGHAIVAHMLPHADRVHRVSIVSRGSALGFTLTPPDKDKYQETRSDMMAEMAVLLGGRVAEDVFFNELTGGASSDIRKVTAVARHMVLDYGMSELGPVNFSPAMDERGYSGTEYRPSPDIQAKVDAEMTRLVAEAEKLTREIVAKHKKVMDKIVEKLLEVETLEAEDFEELVGTPKATLDENLANA